MATLTVTGIPNDYSFDQIVKLFGGYECVCHVARADSTSPWSIMFHNKSQADEALTKLPKQITARYEIEAKLVVRNVPYGYSRQQVFNLFSWSGVVTSVDFEPSTRLWTVMFKEVDDAKLTARLFNGQIIVGGKYPLSIDFEAVQTSTRTSVRLANVADFYDANHLRRLLEHYGELTAMCELQSGTWIAEYHNKIDALNVLKYFTRDGIVVSLCDNRPTDVNSRVLIVGGSEACDPYQEKQIKDAFERYGRLLSVRLVDRAWRIVFEDQRDASDAARDLRGKDIPLLGKLRIMILEHFDEDHRDTLDAAEALKDKDYDISFGNKTLRQKQLIDNPESTILVVSGLKSGTTSVQVGDIFGRYGRIIYLYQSVDNNWKVTFDDSRDAKDALIDLQGKVTKHGKLCISFLVSDPLKSSNSNKKNSSSEPKEQTRVQIKPLSVRFVIQGDLKLQDGTVVAIEPITTEVPVVPRK